MNRSYIAMDTPEKMLACHVLTKAISDWKVKKRNAVGDMYHPYRSEIRKACFNGDIDFWLALLDFPEPLCYDIGGKWFYNQLRKGVL